MRDSIVILQPNFSFLWATTETPSASLEGVRSLKVRFAGANGHRNVVDSMVQLRFVDGDGIIHADVF